MIFVTVGTQLPFDRLVRTIDGWASARPFADAFAQIGPAEYRPKHIPWAEFLDAEECRRKTEQADVVVAHAGMGSILTALEFGRPVLVMPRLSALGEHRNDHQIATAKKLLAQGRIFVAFDEAQLLEKLEYLHHLQPAERIPVHASSSLLQTLRSFVVGEKLQWPAIEIATEIKLPELLPAGLRVQSGPQALVEVATTADFAVGGRQTVARLVSPSNRREPLSDSDKFAGAVKRPVPDWEIKAGLRAIILLGGRLRLTDLGRRIGRSGLDLPVDSDRSLLSYWRDEGARLAEHWDRSHLTIRVLLDQASSTPTLPASVHGITLTVERDQSEYRGTGGVLRDACDEYDDQDWVLVANAAQILFDPLHEFADRLADAGGEINVVNDEDGIPNGLILLRCGVLREISDIGFHDMKEQVVPALAGSRLVKVIPSRGATSMPLHSLQDYMAALRRLHGGATLPGAVGAFAERWQPRFSIREQGAVVAPSAVIQDSVILQGAAVERGAVIVRSVVGPGARIAAGDVIVEQIVN